MQLRSIPAVLTCFVLSSLPVAASKLGIFSDQQDVGTVQKKGKAKYDRKLDTYTVTGGGANIWGSKDAFHYVFEQVNGDVTLTSQISWVGQGTEAHRKAGIMIRASLAPDSPYVDVMVHGNGMTSLQYRETPGGTTKEARSDLNAPKVIRLERRGDQFTLYAGDTADDLKPTGPLTLHLADPVFIGFAVCAHNNALSETAIFKSPKIETGTPVTLGPEPTHTQSSSIKHSKIAVYDLRTKSVDVVFQSDKLLEAPNWSPDGKYLLVNSGGELYRLPLGSSSPQLAKINDDGLLKCNNDKGYSPKGDLIAFSSSGKADGSQVFTVPASGGQPKLIVPETPSYFHAFSPDGKYLSFVSRRNGNFDLFRVPTDGGTQEQLTSNPGYDDGPDYSPDGRWIYFNSNRSGKWEVWRMPADGAGPEDKSAQQITQDDLENWFPHCSPDGKWIVFLSFPRGTETHNDRLPGVRLRLIPMPSETPRDETTETLTTFFGGQGTINVNSWSPDSSKFAYVIYEP